MTDNPQCGCEEIGSPVVGILWAPDTNEVQRCDTHRPAPLFDSDREAADALARQGWTIETDDDGRIFAQPPAQSVPWPSFVTGEPATYPFGTVTITEHGVSIAADQFNLYEWSHRPGAAWPCSTLDELASIVVAFDSGGLLDLTTSTDDPTASEDSAGIDIDGAELSAWACDVLRAVLPVDHPAYDVCVGQFLSADENGAGEPA